MDKNTNALEYVKTLMDEPKEISYDDDEYILVVNEDIDVDDVYSAITTIVEAVVDREFEYELVDLMLPYFYIDLFTDIQAPIIKDENGDEYPDYIECYKLATLLNLEYELTQVSPIVAGYIYMMTQNIWRRLDYHKSQGAYIQRELTDAIGAFYEIMDELDQAVDANKNLDVDTFASQLAEISTALADLNKDNVGD